jgi:dolichol-phosphate mannosyltransferase
MWQLKRIAVVVPAFNEAARVGLTLAGIPSFVDHVIVVDDGSSDMTADAVQTLTERQPSIPAGHAVAVKLIKHEKNQGVGAAIRTGYRAGVELGADILVVMAADNQMDPADVQVLLHALCEFEADYVKGNRFIHPAHAAMPTLRKWGSRFLSQLTRLTTGYDVDDCQCGFTAITARAVTRLPLDELWPRYGYPNDLLALLRRTGARVVEVPVKPIYANESSGLHAGHVFTIAARILRRGVVRHQR